MGAWRWALVRRAVIPWLIPFCRSEKRIPFCHSEERSDEESAFVGPGSRGVIPRFARDDGKPVAAHER